MHNPNEHPAARCCCGNRHFRASNILPHNELSEDSLFIFFKNFRQQPTSWPSKFALMSIAANCASFLGALPSNHGAAEQAKMPAPGVKVDEAYPYQYEKTAGDSAVSLCAALYSDSHGSGVCTEPGWCACCQ